MESSIVSGQRRHWSMNDVKLFIIATRIKIVIQQFGMRLILRRHPDHLADICLKLSCMYDLHVQSIIGRTRGKYIFTECKYISTF